MASVEMERPPGRRERKKRQTRETIARTALELFARQGFKETTVAQIAEAADVAESTFFLHFPTKEDLVFAGHEEEAARLVERLRLPHEGTTLDVLRDYLWDLSAPGAWDGDLWVLRFEVIRRDPALAAQERLRWADVVRPALAESFAVDADEPPPALRARQLAAMTVGALVELGRIEAELEVPPDSAWKREALGQLLGRLEVLAAQP